MKRETFQIPVIGRAAVVQSLDEAARTFDVVWTTGAQVRRYSWFRDEEFDEELVIDPTAIRLDRLNGGAPFLDSHQGYSLRGILGVVEDGSARVEGARGLARIRLSQRDEVEPIWRDIRDGVIRKVSVGYRVHRFERTAAADRTDGVKRALYRAVDWEPLEISAVAMPADPGAGIRSEDPSVLRLAECVLIRQDVSTAADAAIRKGSHMSGKKAAAAAGDVRENEEVVETREDPAPAPAGEDEAARSAATKAAADAAVAEERTRVAEITDICSRHHLPDDFRADLIRRGVKLDEARTVILEKLATLDPMRGRSFEPSFGQVRGSGEPDVAYRDALSEALLHRHNPGLHKLTDAGREFRGMTLLELARHGLERNGVSTRGMSKMELAAAAFQRSAGLHSTSDFPSILANVAGKTLRMAYDSTPRTFAAWARRATITDFKPVQRTQLGGAPDLERVLESGEFKYGTIGEGKEVYALATYGRIVGITRQTLINDDLDAFTRVPAAFGASAADLESDIVYAILMTNPNMQDGVALFDAGHGNLGTAARVTEASLSEAYRLFALQTGLEGRKISVLPSTILVPPGPRSVEARKQVTATTPDSTAGVNTFANRLSVVEEPRLLPASGEDPWFLAADPSRIDTVEFAYLDGQEGVFTETRMGFEVDGVEIKARHDFAAKAIDWRGMFKNAGAAPA